VSVWTYWRGQIPLTLAVIYILFLYIVVSPLPALPWRFVILLVIKLLYWVHVLSFPLARQLSGNVLVDAGFPFHKVTTFRETKKNSVRFTTYTKLRLIDIHQCRGTVCRGCLITKTMVSKFSPLDRPVQCRCGCSCLRSSSKWAHSSV
jgi:hypothetical protein